MSEQPEAIKLKRITIKTESGSRWFDDPHKLQVWCREQRELYSFFRSTTSNHQSHDVFHNFDRCWAHRDQLVSSRVIPHVLQPEACQINALPSLNLFLHFLGDNSSLPRLRQCQTS